MTSSRAAFHPMYDRFAPDIEAGEELAEHVNRDRPFV